MDCADAEGRALGGNCAYRHVLPPSKPFALSLSKGCSFSRRRRKNRASTGSARTAAGQSGIKRCTDMTTLVLHDYFRSSASYRVRIALNLKRSEEHTSELQSLMRISYAVFCLKKKKSMKK